MGVFPGLSTTETDPLPKHAEDRHWNSCDVEFAYPLDVLVILKNMFRLIHPTSYRLFFLPWMVAWILVAPLFHIHTLDAQENHSCSPVFLAHTVFSPDLVGEYSPQSTVHQAEPHEKEATLSTHISHYSEGTISLFSKNHSKQEKNDGLVSKIYSIPPKVLFSNGSRDVTPERVLPPFMLLESSISLRAPPSVSS